MFLPAAEALFITSRVAIMVVAMPRTGVSALPAIRLSTVWSLQRIPTLLLILAITSPAVIDLPGTPCAASGRAVTSAADAANASRLETPSEPIVLLLRRCWVDYIGALRMAQALLGGDVAWWSWAGPIAEVSLTVR